MGWLFHPVPPARDHDRNAEIDRIFTPADPADTTFTILQRSWRGNTCYVACRIQQRSTGKDQTVGFVILTKSYMENGVRWWGVKDMDEDMGPYHTAAPKSLIAKLSPTTNEHALNWRERCLAQTQTPKLTRFRTAAPLSFTFSTRGRQEAQEFEKVSLPHQRGIYRALDLPGQPLVRLSSRHLNGATPLPCYASDPTPTPPTGADPQP